jgi:hypothetical protein
VRVASKSNRQKNFLFFEKFFVGINDENIRVVEPEPNLNRNVLKIGTRTGIGTVTFQKSEPEPEP